MNLDQTYRDAADLCATSGTRVYPTVSVGNSSFLGDSIPDANTSVAPQFPATRLARVGRRCLLLGFAKSDLPAYDCSVKFNEASDQKAWAGQAVDQKIAFR